MENAQTQPIQQNLLLSKKIYSEWLKLFAILFMVIDHIGLVFYPEVTELRQLGRLAFPIFAYQISLGFQLTSNKEKMFKRLVGFAFLSAIPYFLMTNSASLNIFFTLALGFLAMWVLQYRKFYFTLPFILAIPLLVPVDYGIYGVLSILFFYLLRKHFLWQLLGFVILTFLYIGSGGSALQINAVFGVLLVPLLIRFKDLFHVPKYFYYFFYPVHMLLIWVIDVAVK